MTAFPCHLFSWMAAIYILYCCNCGIRALMLQSYIMILHSLYPSSCPIVFAIAIVILCSFLLSEAQHEVLKHYFFMGWSSHAPNFQPVWPGYFFFLGHHLWPVHHGSPASSCTTISTALRIIWSCKPQHYMKAGIPLVEFANVRILPQIGRDYFCIISNSLYSLIILQFDVIKSVLLTVNKHWIDRYVQT